ncbi:MAG: Hsp20/alpha crystallin family protein [Akkermansiaceae bacterium]|nr:Hsp20/alpha crystallin family protein [Akkermansiaceae bacterium]NNM28502.1 Hsp20/alpha crystallin family protein [Akkermansiaceae bacterium]
MNDTKTTLSENEAPAAARTVVRPAYDVREKDGEAILQVALPGVRKEDLNVTVEGQTLVLVADRGDAVPDSWQAKQLAARPDRYELRIRLSSRFDPHRTKARLEHGVLVLRVETREEARPRQIEVHSA